MQAVRERPSWYFLVPYACVLLAAACSKSVHGQGNVAGTAAPQPLQAGFAGAPGNEATVGDDPFAQSPNKPPANQPQAPEGKDQLMEWERRDLGVPASPSLHNGSMHGPTPNQIPGGQLITTKGLVYLLDKHIALVFDVLGAPQTLPDAIPAVPAAQAGDYNDRLQQQFGQMLQRVTSGRDDTPLIFYCQGPECWMSYNAALRAINLGYRNVLWYRGGLEAWQRAGLPLSQARPNGPGPNPGPNPGEYPPTNPGQYPAPNPQQYPAPYPPQNPGGQNQNRDDPYGPANAPDDDNNNNNRR